MVVPMTSVISCNTLRSQNYNKQHILLALGNICDVQIFTTRNSSTSNTFDCNPLQPAKPLWGTKPLCGNVLDV